MPILTVESFNMFYRVATSMSLVLFLLEGVSVASTPHQSEVPPVVFEGFGLEGFSGPGSIAGLMRRTMSSDPQEAIPFDVKVRGPSGKSGSTQPLTTELHSRIRDLDISAGVVATPDVVQDGLTRWVGGLRFESEHIDGREIIEFRTSVLSTDVKDVVRIQFGPRIERRLRRGAILFFDGKAEAQAKQSAETGIWSLPGGATRDTMVGVSARTGFRR